MNARAAAIAVTLVFAQGAAVAQGPPGAAALAVAAVTESLSVLRSLDATLRAHPSDAAAWHRQGMIAWVLAARAEAEPPLKNLDREKLRRLADNSLREAVERAPENARYQLMEGKFLITSEGTGARAASYAYLDRAVAAARKTNDSPLLADAAVVAGRVYWRRYDAIAFQIAGNDSSSTTLVEAEAEGKGEAIHNAYYEVARHGQPVSETGMADYASAEALFREARAAAPHDVRIFRQFAMLLAERHRWTELLVTARGQVRDNPTDAWGWLALGLALHRSQDSPAAVTAFDTALALLPSQERQHLFGLNRVLPPSDTAAFLRADIRARDSRAAQFWTRADPLWSQPGNDARVEFLARVTFAELRWSVEELGVHGADSDRGDIYIRYGPPDVITTRATLATAANIGRAGIAPVGKHRMSDDFIITKWVYYYLGEMFVFWGKPTYGTARIPQQDFVIVDVILQARPYDFGNVVTGHVYTMPTITARFRAPGDSVDLLIATLAPMKEIRAAGAANVPVIADFWMFGRNSPDQYRDSMPFDASGVQVRTRRVPPMNYMFRIEATSPSVSAAGQVMRWIEAGPDTATGFRTRGFGLSDILFATKATERAPSPARWRDFNVTPLFGPLTRNSTVDLIWENYELGARNGAAKYQITITLQRERSAAGRIAAEIVGAVAGSVGVTRRDDRVVLTFDRASPSAAALVEHITMNLLATPPGRYRLVVQITDHVTGRSASRTSQIVIAE